MPDEAAQSVTSQKAAPPPTLTISAATIAAAASKPAPKPNTTATATATAATNTSSNGKQRSTVQPGVKVQIFLKADQRSGKLTEGVVDRLLTNSASHPHGIKVMLKDGQVGRVQKVFG